VDEYWVCQHCRSLNRAASGKCYSCGAKFGSRPKQAATSKGQAGPSGPVAVAPVAPVAPPPPPPPSFTSQYGANSGAEPAYLSRPVVVAPQPYLTETRSRGRLPNLAAPFERRISAALAVRPIVSVASLGYATAALLVVLFLAAGMVSLTGLRAATYALQHADIQAGWNQLSTDQQSLIETVAISMIGFLVATVAFFAVFVGLSTHNTTGLGAEATLLTPRSGATVWIRLTWVQIRLVIGILLPTVLVWYGYLLPGLIVGVVVVEIAQRHVDDMLDWLSRPAGHLPDLYRKMGAQGARPSILASIWSILFRTANLAIDAACLAVPLALSFDVAMKASGRHLDLWRSAGFGPAQLALGAIFAVAAVASALCLLFTVAMVVGLVGRQRTRRTLARVGRSRSWLARPGEGAYGAAGAGAGAAGAGAAAYGAAQAGAAGYGGPAAFGEEDRFVDRYPEGTLPPGYPADDSFSARVEQARSGMGGLGQQAPWPGAQPPQPLQGQDAAWTGARQPIPPGTPPPMPMSPHLPQMPAAPPPMPMPAAPPPMPMPAPPAPRMPAAGTPGQPPRQFPPATGWPGGRPPATPGSIPPAPPAAPARPEYDEDMGSFSRTNDPVAGLGRAQELPRPPEGWPGPKPGGLLHRISGQMSPAPGSSDPGDQASLNSPSTTSSPSAPDPSSEPPSD
jgi:hypothetical protein